MNVTQFPRDGQLEILLLHTSDTGTVTEAERWWRYGNGTYVGTSLHCDDTLQISIWF